MTEIYLDGADIQTIIEMNSDPVIRGFTTNPTLMKKSGIKNYVKFAKEILSVVTWKPVSFEILSDDYLEMLMQAKQISEWGNNVYVKIPVMSTKGLFNFGLMNTLSKFGIKVNATAVTSCEQIMEIVKALDTNTPSIISIFAGRIADTGRNPKPFIGFGAQIKKDNQKILWASTREAYNITQAEEAGADIITVSPEILKKALELTGKDLHSVSLDTVKMFYNDAKESGFSI